MSSVDIVLLIIIAAFAMTGWRVGIIHALGSLIGAVAGIYLASRYYQGFAAWLIHFTGWSGDFAKILCFILAFVIINRLVGFGFWILDKVFGIFTRLPFIHGLNNFLGLVFGLLEGIIVVGISIYFINKFALKIDFLKSLAQSNVALFSLKFSAFLWPLMPKDIVDIFNQLTQFALPSWLKLPAVSIPPTFTLPKELTLPTVKSN